METSTVNDLLRGHTVLLRLGFETLDGAATYQLRLELAQSESFGSPAVSVTFNDVSNLCLSEFGGGLTQILCLSVADIRDRQWDRANFEVFDAERQTISFTCGSVGAVRPYCVEGKSA